MLEKSFNDLCANLGYFRNSLRQVQVAATHQESLSAELRGLLAALDAVTLAAERARNAARLPVDVDAVRRSLPHCQRQLSVLKERFYGGIGAPAELDAHRAEGRQEVAWYLGRCQPPLRAAEWSVSACWSELGEYSLLNPGGAMPGFVPPGP